jgi:hypothetical protein
VARLQGAFRVVTATFITIGGLQFFFLNLNLYSAHVRLGTGAVTYNINYVLCSNMCGDKGSSQRKLALDSVRWWGWSGMSVRV